MDEYKKYLNIIEQTMNDTKYIKDSYQPTFGIIKILKYWFILYFLSILSFFCIDKINMYYELYNYSSFYTIYNVYRIIICIAIPTLLLFCALKSEISVKERRYLKIWLIFPIFFCLDNCLSSFSSLLNAETMISFYQSFPISGIINIVFLLYLYSYFKYKGISVLIIMYIVYCGFSFYYLSIYLNLIDASLIQTNLFMILNNIQSYRIIEILSLLISIIVIKKKE